MPNPVEVRLRKVQEMFADNFPESRTAGVCLWIVEDEQESRMIQALVATESSQGAVFVDAFLQCNVQAAGAPGWAGAAAQHLHRQWLAALDDPDLSMDDPTLSEPPRVSDLRQLFDYTQRLTGTFTDPGTRTVLYLHPLAIYDETRYLNDLKTAIQGRLPNQFILLLDAPKESLLARRLARDAIIPDLTVLHPNLDMDGALNEIINDRPEGNQEANFTRHFYAMSKAGERGDFATVRQEANAALRIARNTPQLAGNIYVVHAGEGTLLLNHRRYEEALACYERAHQAADEAVESGLPQGNTALAQALNLEALAKFYLKRYEEAAYTYESAADASVGGDQLLTRYEALRMATHCYIEGRQPERAWERGLEALDIAETLPAEQSAHSTLPYHGEALLRLVDTLNVAGGRAKINRRMESLVGPDWVDRLQ